MMRTMRTVLLAITALLLGCGEMPRHETDEYGHIVYSPDDSSGSGSPSGALRDRSSGVQDVHIEGEEIHIEVSDRGYTPAAIELKKGVEARLIFHVTGTSKCASRVVIPELGVDESLTIGDEVDVDLTPEKTGEFTMSCGGGGFSGVVRVVP